MLNVPFVHIFLAKQCYYNNTLMVCFISVMSRFAELMRVQTG